MIVSTGNLPLALSTSCGFAVPLRRQWGLTAGRLTQGRARAAMPGLGWCRGFEVSTKRAAVRSLRGRPKIDKRNAAMPGAPASTSARLGGWLSDQPYLLLSLTSLFWAGNTVLGRYVVGHIPPMALAFGRWGGAFLILLPFAVSHLARDWLVIRKNAALMALLALVGFSAYNTMAYYGLQYTTAINGLLLQSIGPLFVALWTFALFGDRLTLRQAGGICVSLSGVIVIICHG